jgi:hypothetical protein
LRRWGGRGRASCRARTCLPHSAGAAGSHERRIRISSIAARLQQQLRTFNRRVGTLGLRRGHSTIREDIVLRRGVANRRLRHPVQAAVVAVGTLWLTTRTLLQDSHPPFLIMKGNSMKRRTVHEKAMLMIGAWRDRCADKAFFRMSLADFTAIVAPSGMARERVATLKAQLREAIRQCEEADRTTRRAIVRVVNGVKGDPDEGEDGDLLSAMGYMKHTVRSGILSDARRRSARVAAGRENH